MLAGLSLHAGTASAGTRLRAGDTPAALFKRLDNAPARVPARFGKGEVLGIHLDAAASTPEGQFLAVVRSIVGDAFGSPLGAVAHGGTVPNEFATIIFVVYPRRGHLAPLTSAHVAQRAKRGAIEADAHGATGTFRTITLTARVGTDRVAYAYAFQGNVFLLGISTGPGSQKANALALADAGVRTVASVAKPTS